MSTENAVDTQAKRERWYEKYTEVWQYRELLYQMVLRDLRLRYKQTIIGFAWALFTPMMIVASGCIIKLAMSQLSGAAFDLMSFAGMTVKAVTWSFLSGGLAFGSMCLVSNIGLVTKIYFPREVFPLSGILIQIFDTFIAALVLGVLFLILGVPLTFQALWLPFLVLQAICLITAVIMLVSTANVFYRDVKYITGVILSFGIFFSPVFYEPQVFGPQGNLAIMANPVSPILEGIRLTLVGTPDSTERVQNADGTLTQPTYHTVNLLDTVYINDGKTLVWTPWYLVYSSILSFGGLIYAWRKFHRLEFIFPEYI
ncbi:MAG: ABC transporter permease [Planctomycetia bacterium]|nr:ABC transporter permease [Planctomycetia bacterium]